MEEMFSSPMLFSIIADTKAPDILDIIGMFLHFLCDYLFILWLYGYSLTNPLDISSTTTFLLGNSYWILGQCSQGFVPSITIVDHIMSVVQTPSLWS